MIHPGPLPEAPLTARPPFQILTLQDESTLQPPSQQDLENFKLEETTALATTVRGHLPDVAEVLGIGSTLQFCSHCCIALPWHWAKKAVRLLSLGKKTGLVLPKAILLLFL